MELYTKNGRPLHVSEDKVYSRSGKIAGQIKGEKVFATDGRYVGSIVGDRLVHRSMDSAAMSYPFSASDRSVSVKANKSRGSVWGDEPEIGY